jgi:hypothetical protein
VDSLKKVAVSKLGSVGRLRTSPVECLDFGSKAQLNCHSDSSSTGQRKINEQDTPNSSNHNKEY